MSPRLPPSLRSLLNAIERFERGEIDVDALQSAIRSAEETVTEYELRGLRTFLRGAEGRLELNRFTLDSDRGAVEAMELAQVVRARVSEEFGDSD